MGKRKADAPPQLDLAPEVGDIGFVASAHPSKETTTCETTSSEYVAGKEAVELEPFGYSSAKLGIRSGDHPLLYLGLRRKGGWEKPGAVIRGRQGGYQ